MNVQGGNSMKIEASIISMSSQHDHFSFSMKKEETFLTTAAQAATLDFSEEGLNMADLIKKEQERLQEESRKQQEANMAQQYLWQQKQAEEASRKQMTTAEDATSLELELLRKMVLSLRRMLRGNSKEGIQELERLEKAFEKKTAPTTCESTGFFGAAASNSRMSFAVTASQAGPIGGKNVWTKTTVQSAFVTEAEHTAFQTTGVAKTADGREINFGVTLEMSSAFCAQYNSMSQEDYVVTDPLVINLDTNVASVTEQKFMFDLDADGTQDEISFVGKGSGFLTLDKNQDGIINDGSELFGTANGDGFADLAAYDSDKNGWIDENDNIFRQLQIWTKDEEGNDKLYSLKEAGVGALYLGNADTEFTLRSNENMLKTNGIIRKTGIYLKENGEVSTLQHVDLAL